MRIDVTPLLKRLVLAGLPLGQVACYPCDLPVKPFETTIAVLEDEYEVLVPGRPRLDAGPLPTDANEWLRHTLTPQARAEYEACLHDSNRCREFCLTIGNRMFNQLKLQDCNLVQNGTDRPDVQLSGLGTTAVCGRRPGGLCPVPTRTEGSPAGRYLAQATHLEAASVTAFERLADELDGHGAPPGLGRGARRAARDEARHARLVGRLARAAGSRPPGLRVKPPRRRTLAALAIENATEGCVRETFGALIAWWQAAAATDPAVRRVARSIAPDESRHANLAWQIDAWARRRLPVRSQRQLDAARARAARTLAKDWGDTLPPEVRQPLGLPDGETATALVAELDRRLFRAPA
jgi:hypothetical protein